MGQHSWLPDDVVAVLVEECQLQEKLEPWGKQEGLVDHGQKEREERHS